MLNFAGGRDAVVVSVWVLMLVGIGVGFAAVVVVTGTIWPPVVIRAVLFFARALQFGADDSAAPGSALWSAAWHSARSPPPTASGCCAATCTGTTATRVRTPQVSAPKDHTFRSVIGSSDPSASNHCGWSMMVEHTGLMAAGRPRPVPFLGCRSESHLIQIFDSGDTSAAWPRAGSPKACSMVRSRV